MATITDCSSILFAYNLRRQSQLFNVPPPRYTLSSPYQHYTKQQLDMRRKVEVLKYNSTTQASQTNSLTKNQLFAQVARGTSYVGNLAKCTTGTVQSMSTLPTLTTACDVPGPPMILQYDPSIPLYNYGSEVRSYAVTPSSSVQWNSFTVDELTFINSFDHTFEHDSSNNPIEERIMPVGSFIFTSFAALNDTYYVPMIQSPLGLYVNFVYGFGLSTNGVYVPPKLFDIQRSNILTLTVTDVRLLVYFNGNLVTLDPAPTISYDIVDLVIDCNQFQQLSPHIQRLQGQYYGIQYVGMVTIEHIYLPASPSFVYEFQLVTDYVYDHTFLPFFDVFQSGVFPNLSPANQSATFNGLRFNPSSTPPPKYAPATFSQLN